MENYCTLFDSRYIDKGIALYESLVSCGCDFTLYVFAFDDVCHNALTSMALEHMTVISLKEFETERMLQVKSKRSFAEYCWTCTPFTIDYVIAHYHVGRCTYVDADIYFFRDPAPLFREMEDTGDSVIIVEHRFPAKIRKREISESGKYCVQFNTFVNNSEGLKVLHWWKERCLEWCYFKKKGELLGDQKYLECWPEKFRGVHEMRHLGGGVARWNVSQYEIADCNKLIFRYYGMEFPLIFYHFQNIRYLPFGLVNTRSDKFDKKLRDYVYKPYLRHTERIRQMLFNNYGIKFDIRKSYFKNPVLRFLQDYVMPFKVTSLTDIIVLRKLREMDGSR